MEHELQERSRREWPYLVKYSWTVINNRDGGVRCSKEKEKRREREDEEETQEEEDGIPSGNKYIILRGEKHHNRAHCSSTTAILNSQPGPLELLMVQAEEE